MHTVIIAEAGVNHNGDLNVAKQLIDVASMAGVDYIKFQTFNAKLLVSNDGKKADYQTKNTNSNESQLEMLKKLELSKEDHLELIEYCKEKKINFFSTAFDEQSIELLKEFGLKLFKIPSGEITNLPYLRKIATIAESVIISTGMCTLSEVGDAVNFFKRSGFENDRIILLHCNTEYPTPMKDVNLNAMRTLEKEFEVNVGYSDHTLGIEVPIAAVALGAVMIEKHITLDRNMTGPDHAASIEPNELIQMVKSIRNIEAALGDGIKAPSQSEQKNISIARKSIHIANTINAGSIIQENDLIMLRPGDGISPMQIDSVVGQVALFNLDKGTKLNKSHFSNEN